MQRILGDNASPAGGAASEPAPAPRPAKPSMKASTSAADANLNGIANFIWGIADDVLRDLYVRGKYRDVILPMADLLALEKETEGLLGEIIGGGSR